MAKRSKSDMLDEVFSALSDPARRAIVEQLAREGDKRVGELKLPRPLSPPAVAKHLRVLERAGLLSQRIKGRTRQCSANLAPLAHLGTWARSLGAPAAPKSPTVAPPKRSSSNRAVLERLFGLKG